MKALSVQQPWAWALLHGKPVENRTWRAPQFMIGKMFVIHAAKKFDKDGYWWLQENSDLLDSELPEMDQFERGGIVGKARLIKCVEEHESPFFFGPFGLVVEDASRLAFVEYRGQLGFFDVPDVLVRPI